MAAGKGGPDGTRGEPLLRIGERKTVAGGAAAIQSAMRHALGEMLPAAALESLRSVNQSGGFDCPGCAWPDPDGERSMAEFCENGAKAVAEEATSKRVDRSFFGEWPVSALLEMSEYWLGKQGRLCEPMLLAEGDSHYRPVSWDEAFELTARELGKLDSPDRAIFYTSGRASNEAAFLYQLFVRMFGTNNLPDCSNMCHESSGVAMGETLGVGKGTVALDDFDHADCILVVGQNPGTNHPRMLTSLQRAARRGCRIITINPLPEAGSLGFIHPQEVRQWFGGGTSLTTLFLQVRINGDVALLKGIMKELLLMEEERPGTVLDRAFIRGHTLGFEELARDLGAESWELIVSESGIGRARIREAAQIIASSKSMICCWAMGLTQHRNAVANIQEIVNLLLLGGHIGRRGAGACPVRGHSNVQGDRTMGICEKPRKDFLDRLAAEAGFEPPRRHGFDTVESIKAMHGGNAGVFFALGGNFLSASPDTLYTEQALRRCDLTVHVSTKLNRSHLIGGRNSLILPCLGRTEADLRSGRPQVVSVENSMGIVHSSRGHLQPASPLLRSEVAIVAGLAEAVFRGTPKQGKIDWAGLAGDYSGIRKMIARVVPGFEDFEERLARPGGFYLPNPVRDSRTFLTASGKAHFTVHPIPSSGLREGEYMLMTIRSHDQFNTTIYGLDDRYRGVYSGRRVVFLNRQDMRAAGIGEGAKLDLTSCADGTQRTAKSFAAVGYDIPPRCAAAYFPETNVLVPIGSTADKSNTPASKSIPVRLSPSLEG